MGSFEKATKSKAKLRMCLYGISGSGKTFTALRMATGIGGSIAVIDSERARACKYGDKFDFDVCGLENKTIDEYQIKIAEAEASGYEILIIDSLSHAWRELLEEVDRLAAAKFSGNSYNAWSKGTPKQLRFIDMIVTYPGHVIATMRSRTEWAEQDNGRGGKRYVRTGTSPVQGKGLEYEFDMMMQLDAEHNGVIEKDNSDQFQGQVVQCPGEDFGRAMAAWLEDGETDPNFERKRLGQRIRSARELAIAGGCTPEQLDTALEPVKGKTQDETTVEQLQEALAAVEALEPEVAPSRAAAAAAAHTAPIESF